MTLADLISPMIEGEEDNESQKETESDSQQAINTVFDLLAPHREEIQLISE